MFQTQQRVKFTRGEYQGSLGEILRLIPMRYREETRTYQIQLDGFPIPGGWDGKVYGHDYDMERVD